MSEFVVWTVTAEAVYDHGCYGVFSTLDAAEAHARALWDRSDGHHTLRVDRFVVDVGLKDDGKVVGYGDDAERAARRAARLNPAVRVT